MTEEIVNKPDSVTEIFETKQRLELLLTQLYNDPMDRFYAYLFYQVDRVVDNKNCTTLGVSMHGGRIRLSVNSKFLKKLSDHAAIVILKHESLHLINDHLERGQGAKQKDMTKHQMENIAMDCAINQYLDHKVIDEIGGVTLERFRKLLTHLPENTTIKEKATFEYYYDLLDQEKDHREQQGGQEQGDGQGGKSLEEQLKELGMDDHGSFGQMDALDRAMLEEKIRKAAEGARGDGAGRLPSEVEELLKIKKKPKVNWKRKLKQFIGAGIRANKTSSRRHRNRRYGITFAGHKRDHIARILVVLDTSGSMWGDRTDKVMSELYGIWKANDGLKLDIVECDAQVQEVFTYDGKDSFKMKGGGGTDMTPALKFGKEQKYDSVICLTDLEFWNEDWEPYKSMNVLWLVANNDGAKPPFGQACYV